jgi:Lar family restriction alleviation protein
MSEAIKPCPFCGGEAYFAVGKIVDGRDWHYVECVQCGAIGPDVKYADHNIAVKSANALAWNTRTPDPHIEALTAEREFFEEEWVSAVDKLNKAVEALDGLLEAITATTQHGDRSLTITGPTANLKWLLETEEEARATLDEIEGEKT